MLQSATWGRPPPAKADKNSHNNTVDVDTTLKPINLTYSPSIIHLTVERLSDITESLTESVGFRFADSLL